MGSASNTMMQSVHFDPHRTDPRQFSVLLVDDQLIVGETIRAMLAEIPGCRFLQCTDPSKAIETANQFQPTVILQDLVMPEVDGIVLVKFFRVNKGTRDTPMIVLSSKYEPEVKALAFACGANDYLVKIPDQLELIARVKYHAQYHLNLLERNEAFRKLAAAEQQMAQELSQASKYVQSLLPKPLNGRVKTRWKFVPSSQLAGDMFGYHWLDDDHFAVYLLDVSGHGVGSALLAVSAGNVLSNRSLPETDFADPGRVLSRLNDVFQMDRQNEKYFTIWYGVFHAPSRTLRYGNAGHPAPILAAPGGSLRELSSSGFAVGMVPDWTFETEEVVLESGARLLVFSDGVFEIEFADGRMWHYAEFVGFLKTLPEGDPQIMEKLYEHVRALRGGNGILNDDFSIVEVRF